MRCSSAASGLRCGAARCPVLGPEDLVVTKALAHGEETAHYWWDALAIVAKGELDWDYLLMRAPARAAPDAQPAAVRPVDRPRRARPRDPPAVDRRRWGTNR